MKSLRLITKYCRAPPGRLIIFLILLFSSEAGAIVLTYIVVFIPGLVVIFITRYSSLSLLSGKANCSAILGPQFERFLLLLIILPPL